MKILMCSQSIKKTFCEVDNETEAREICDLYNWELVDENGFVWDLEIES